MEEIFDMRLPPWMTSPMRDVGEAGWGGAEVPPVEAKPKPPYGRDMSQSPPIEFKVPFSCEGRDKNIRDTLIILEGVDSVESDIDNEKVTITGKLNPEDALSEVRWVVRRSDFWSKKNEKEKKNDRAKETADEDSLVDTVEVSREQHSAVTVAQDPNILLFSSKKRKRPSRKPPTIVKASPDQFRETVTRLTGTLPQLKTDASSLVQRAKAAPGTILSEDFIWEVENGDEGNERESMLRSTYVSLGAISYSDIDPTSPVRKCTSFSTTELSEKLNTVFLTEAEEEAEEKARQQMNAMPFEEPGTSGAFVSSGERSSGSSSGPGQSNIVSSNSAEDNQTSHHIGLRDKLAEHPIELSVITPNNGGLVEESEVATGANCVRGTCCAQDLIREVEDRPEDGYFLSSEWLLSLEPNQKQSLMSILSIAGYSEIYCTGTTILFERIENDLQSPIDGNIPSSMGTTTDCRPKDLQQVESLQRRTAVEGLNADNRPGIATSHGSEYLPETSGIVPIAGTTVTLDPVATSSTVKDELMSMSLAEKAHGKYTATSSTSDISQDAQQPTTLNSFILALKSSHQHSYAVSTDWLFNLEDHERRELETIILEVGYTKIHKESNTTTFEKIRDDVGLPSSSLCNNPTGTSNKSDIGVSDTGKQEACGSDDLLSKDKLKGKLDSEDNTTDRVGVASTVERGGTQGDREADNCRPQILKVICSPVSDIPTISSTSSSRGPNLRHFRRQQVGDCVVTMPRKGESLTISTAMERPFSMRTISFTDMGNSTWREECVTLKATATTTTSCCLRINHPSKRIRIKFSKISGEVRNETSSGQQRCNALVLSSLRTNLYACVDKEETEDASEEIILRLENGRRALDDGLAWLEISGRNPVNSELGSITLELQGDFRKRCKADLASQVQRAHVLHFQEPLPVVLEGEVPVPLNPELFLELNVRYQLEVSYIRPCTPISTEAKFLAGRRTSEVIDFDCCLDFMTKKFSFD